MKKIVPHLSLSLGLAVLTLFVLDRFNNVMGFMTSNLSRWLIGISALASVCTSVCLIAENIRSKTNAVPPAEKESPADRAASEQDAYILRDDMSILKGTPGSCGVPQEKKGNIMKKLFQEFKEFALKGNVIDMAIGVVIGAAFKAIVDSLVGDLISPLIGLLFKNDFADLAFKIGEVEIKYGAFITAVINFLIVALVLFAVVKGINAAKKLTEKKPAPAAPAKPTTKVCPYCKSEIAIDATRCPHCTSELK